MKTFFINLKHKFQKTKLINFLMFLLFNILLQITFNIIVFNKFLPIYFYLDFFLMMSLGALIFFFKSNKFDQIYLSIILFLYTLMYGLNVGYFKVTQNLFMLKDLINISSLFKRTGDHAGQFPFGLFMIFIDIFCIFEILIILFNAKYGKKFNTLNERKTNKRRRVTASIFLASSVIVYSSGVPFMCFIERKFYANYTFNHINYSSYYNTKKMGLPTYYLFEFGNLLFYRPMSVNKIKAYLKDASYVTDSFTEILKGFNVINILFETGQTFLLNPYTTPNMTSLINDGLYLKNNTSFNNTFPSEMFLLVGNNPNYLIDTYREYNFPFSIAKLLNNKGYTSSYYCNFTQQDFFSQKKLMPRFGFNNVYYEEHLRKGKDSSNDPDSDFASFKQIRKDIEQIHSPFYIHFTSSFTHFPYGNNDHDGLFRLLKTKYSEELDNYEREGKWENKLKNKGKSYEDQYRNYTLAAMDFDKGLGHLLEYIKSNDGLKENTLITICGDHEAAYKLGNDLTMTQNVNNTKEYLDVKNFKTTGIIWGGSKLKEKLQSSVFEKFSSPMNIYPTIMDLLGIKYNPKLCQGKSIFQNDYNDEVFYSVAKQCYLNDNYYSKSGFQIEKIFSDNNTKESFLNKVKSMSEQMEYLDEIYGNGIFEKYNYEDFLPQNT